MNNETMNNFFFVPLRELRGREFQFLTGLTQFTEIFITNVTNIPNLTNKTKEKFVVFVYSSHS